jgi:MYXO-CTERM domain-containing protein
VNYSSHLNMTPTPEPTTLVSAVAGLGLLGGITWARRRRTA